jgi:type VI secretion system secreted protein Hcp
MAHSIFCKIGAIPGSGTVKDHKDEIEVLSFSYGVAHPFSQGKSAGERNHSDVSIMKQSDKASGPLMLHCINGKVIDEVVFTFYRDDRTSKEEAYVKITLKNAAVSSWSASASAGDGLPGLGENVSFTFEEIVFEGKEVGNASDSYRVLK